MTMTPSSNTTCPECGQSVHTKLLQRIHLERYHLGTGQIPSEPDKSECYHGFYSENCPSCEAWLAAREALPNAEGNPSAAGTDAMPQSEGPDKQPEPCPKCGGSGEVELFKDRGPKWLEDCPDCHGSGEVKEPTAHRRCVSEGTSSTCFVGTGPCPKAFDAPTPPTETPQDWLDEVFINFATRLPDYDDPEMVNRLLARAKAAIEQHITDAKLDELTRLITPNPDAEPYHGETYIKVVLVSDVEARIAELGELANPQSKEDMK